MSELGRVGDLAVVWSWKIRVGGKRDGGGRGIWEETLICSASICYLSAEFGLGITHIFAHIARPAEVGPLLVLPSRVIIARWILISYCMEERQEYPVRDLSAVRAIFERDVRLTQLRTRSNMRYSSSSTNVDASYGISTSSGAHPRTFRTRLSLAYRILRKVSALPTSPGPYSPRNAPLQIIRRYSIGQISPRLCSSGLLYSEGTHVPAPPDG